MCIRDSYYDVDRKEYVAYVRAWQAHVKAPGMEAVNPDGWIAAGRRSIGRAVSRDFRHFGKPEIVVSTGAHMPPSHLYYTNGKTTLPGIPDNHVMFPWRWELESDGGSTWLLSSPDGTVWSQVPGGPVVETGAPGTSSGGYVVCSGNLLEYPGWLLCGFLVPLDLFPGWVQWLAQTLPPTWGMAAIRSAAAGQTPWGAIAVCAGLGLGYAVLATILSERLVDSARSNATLALRRAESTGRSDRICLLYTSDAADEITCVDLGGRRMLKKKTQQPTDQMYQHTTEKKTHNTS